MSRQYIKSKQNYLFLVLGTTIIILIFLIVMPIITINTGIMRNSSKQDIDNINKIDGEEVKEKINKDIVLDTDTVKVYITETAQVEEVNIEDYICGVVSNEMPANFQEEALKAQAIAARTFLINKINNKCPKAHGADICDSTHCQVYTSKEKRIAKWEANKGEEYWSKIKNAVEDTSGKVLTYNGEVLLYPQYFSTSSGNTEDAVDVFSNEVPYLKSVVSSGEEAAPKYVSDKTIDLDKFINILNANIENMNISYSNISNDFIKIERSKAGGIRQLEICGIKIKGTDFRSLLGLNSTNFTYVVEGNNIIFTCKGYGHGVGMSQWGANAMAKAGSNYDEILKHYYTGVEISNISYKN